MVNLRTYYLKVFKEKGTLSWMNFCDQLLCKKVRDGSFFMRCVKPEIHDIEVRKNMLYVKRPNQRNWRFFKKIAVSLGIFINNIAELVVDNALCEEIFAKCFQLLFN